MNESEIEIKSFSFGEIRKMSKGEIRDRILELENRMSKVEGAVFGDNDICQLKHSFGDGIYVREIFIPKGMTVMGKIHKYDCAYFLLKGEITAFSESRGVENIKAPHYMISSAGTKRVSYAHEDTIRVTIHKNPHDIRDLEELEDYLIAKNYDEFERFKNEELLKIN